MSNCSLIDAVEVVHPDTLFIHLLFLKSIEHKVINFSWHNLF